MVFARTFSLISVILDQSHFPEAIDIRQSDLIFTSCTGLTAIYAGKLARHFNTSKQLQFNALSGCSYLQLKTSTFQHITFVYACWCAFSSVHARIFHGCVSLLIARADLGGEVIQSHQGTTYDQKQYVPFHHHC